MAEANDLEGRRDVGGKHGEQAGIRSLRTEARHSSPDYRRNHQQGGLS
jgi:hypothetical protein